MACSGDAARRADSPAAKKSNPRLAKGQHEAISEEHRKQRPRSAHRASVLLLACAEDVEPGADDCPQTEGEPPDTHDRCP
jgi:hypothetical protein